MPSHCCVPLCNGKGGHLFPTNEELKKKWLAAIRRQKFIPQACTVVCRKHFDSDQYIQETTHETRTACPTELQQHCQTPPCNQGRPILGIKIHTADAACKASENKLQKKPSLKRVPVFDGCTFCRRNGERIQYVNNHQLRNEVTGAISCPVLRKYVCPVCLATGDNAHTRFYCPFANAQEKSGVAFGVAIKSTRRNSTHDRVNCPKRLHPDE